MKRVLLGMLLGGVALSAGATDFETLRRPVATFSIVARDPATGQMGVAVQSHWFSVGQVVPWAEAGVGAVATQSFVEPSYGPLGLDLMRAGKPAPQALKALLAGDPTPEVRQVAMLDAQGRVDAYTGKSDIAYAGQIVGEQFSVQSNMMLNATIPAAMAKAYRSAKGDLAERLLQALEAAQTAGGDVRGRQSAAIIVVAGQSSGQPWADRLFDLRVEDNPYPIRELRRLVTMQRAYTKLNEGDGYVAKGEIEKALASYHAAMELVPDKATNGEAPFWVGVTLASIGRADESLPYLKRAYAQDHNWKKLLERLPAAGLLPQDPGLLKRLAAAMQ